MGHLIKKELICFISTLGFVVFLGFLLFGSKGFRADATSYINIHDTYMVFKTYQIIMALGILTFFGVYGIRALTSRLRNLAINAVFFLSTLLLTLLTGLIAGILEASLPPDYSWTTYIPYALQLMLMLLLVYVGFKSWICFMNKEEKK